jgi:magnesium chelatase family protein
LVALVHSGAVLGIDGYPVEVKVNLSQGLPDAAVKESSDRVSAAIRNTQLSPRKKNHDQLSSRRHP